MAMGERPGKKTFLLASISQAVYMAPNWVREQKSCWHFQGGHQSHALDRALAAWAWAGVCDWLHGSRPGSARKVSTGTGRFERYLAYSRPIRTGPPKDSRKNKGEDLGSS
ncbi:uncharacterized protein RHO17_016975 [Thomomys bottae]